MVLSHSKINSILPSVVQEREKAVPLCRSQWQLCAFQSGDCVAKAENLGWEKRVYWRENTKYTAYKQHSCSVLFHFMMYVCMCENFTHRCCSISLSLFSRIIHLEHAWARHQINIGLFWLEWNTISSRKSLGKISQLLEASVGCACVKEQGDWAGLGWLWASTYTAHQ